MTPPRKVLGNVNDVSTNRFKAAWLSSFGRDKADVRPAHKTWLDRHVVWAVEAECSSEDEHAGSPDIWQVWVVGATSRTGSFRHNLSLSRRRAEAVRAYLSDRMKDFKVAWNIEVKGMSEIPASVIGRKDDVEKAFDRGVLVIVQKNAVELPAVRPPQRLLVRFYWYGNSTAFLKAGHWEGWLYALYKSQGVDIYDSWRTTAGGLDLATGQDGLRFGYGEGEVLAGYDEEEFESEADLDKFFSNKELVMSLEGSKLFAIVGGYQLMLPTNFKALIKYARLQGKTSARKRLPDHLRFPAPRLQDGKWVHDKEWGPWYEPQTGVPA